MRQFLASLAALLMACGVPDECSTIGCPNGFSVSVTVRAPAIQDAVSRGTLEVCVGDDCRTEAFESSSPGAVAIVAVTGDPGDQVRSDLTMPDGTRYTAAGTLVANRPNGDCGSTCTGAELQLQSP